VAAAAAVLACLAPLPPAHATYPGSKPGRLVFGADRDPSGTAPDIYSVLPNGRALHRLTDHPAADICPSWSSDGKEIAFCSNRSGTYQIWTMKHNGKRQRQVTDLGVPALFPDFSPDGTQIAFMAGVGPDVDLYVLHRATGAVTRLTVTPGHDGFPAWSPDGTQIAFNSAREGGVPQVWVMSADGSAPVQLTFDAAPKGQLPDWSPDGSKIAYQSSATGGGDIYVMNADGSSKVQLTSTPEQEFGPAWSPDGAQIAFVRVLGASPLDRAIYVMDADGSDAREVAQGSRVPTWQPRGHRHH
jgi:Tol biopolymer transport system component